VSPRPGAPALSAPRQRWLLVLLIGLVGLLFGCLVGGAIGFVVGHAVGGDRHGHHWQGPGYDDRHYPMGPGGPGGQGGPFPPYRQAPPNAPSSPAPSPS
jgi:hypothetical protein